MKKHVILTIVFAMLLLTISPATAAQRDQMRLAEMSDEQCIAFLESHGVEIPPLYEDESVWMVFIRSTIETG